MKVKTLLGLVCVLLSCKKPTIEEPTAKEPPPKKVELSFEKLQEGQEAYGFQAVSLYQNEQGAPLGARFFHQKTGFTLDLLALQTSPQAFVWVNSWPTSDKGEPHTQEHLLLGKGDQGRALANFQSMSLVESSAFTLQTRTAYHFQTDAGPEIFYLALETQLNAMLNPDYTDEEIRREVRNFSVVTDEKTKALRLEEKGTVYQEMSSTFAGPNSRLYDTLGRLLYGQKHPLSFSSGGTPEALRTLSPEDIRTFHQKNYQLHQMGAVCALPKEMTLGDVLSRVDASLQKLSTAKGAQEKKHFPERQGAPSGQVQIVEYPNENEQQAGDILFAWPPPKSLSPKERHLLSLFLASVAGDASTNLYKLLIDAKTRSLETSAKGVFSFLDDELWEDSGIYIGLNGVKPDQMNQESLTRMRKVILEEMSRIAALPDGSPELKELSERVKNRITQTRRSFAKLADSPPGFGFRNTGPQWMYHLDAINRQAGFAKSLTWKEALVEVEALVASEKNIWKELLSSWGLLAEPYIVCAKPSAALIAKEEEARKQRAAEELQRLKGKYGLTEEQAALQKYKADYDAATEVLAQKEKKQASLRFLERPPMTLDDTLDFTVKKLRDEILMVASTFDAMSSTTTGLALSLQGVPEEKLVYLALLPALLTRVGVIEAGTPVSFEEMSERQRREILSLSAYFKADLRTKRVEIVLRGAGNTLEESQKSLQWMKLVLASPDWRPENLPRIRDAVDQSLSRLRERTLGPEEAWVNDPVDAYWSQTHPLLLATSSFYSRTYFAYRMRWLLKDAGTPEDKTALEDFFKNLPLLIPLTGDVRGGLKSSLAALQARKVAFDPTKAKKKIAPNQKQYVEAAFDRLSPQARDLAKELLSDLSQLLADLPDETLEKDFKALCQRLLQDLLTPPSETLSALQSLRESLLITGGARMFQIGSSTSQEKLSEGVTSLLSLLQRAPVTKAAYPERRRVDERVLEHNKGELRFVGLVQPSLQGGVFLNYIPSTSYLDDRKEALLSYLGSRLYAGHGAHGIFMKTWGAGLAYSNGIRGSLREGRVAYYAERTPLLPQTLSFVIQVLQEAKPDPNLTEYAIAMAFQDSRAAASYESRGEAMAEDLADGVGPEVVKSFRQKILDLRKEPNLTQNIFDKMKEIYAALLPGFDPARQTKEAVYFVIGAEKQLKAYEEYLQSTVSKDATLSRIYPRDFWLY